MPFTKAAALARISGVALLASLGASAAGAQTLVDQWASIKKPPPPVLKSVQVDPKTTALLILDYLPKICGGRPDCQAALPKVSDFLAKARAHNMPIVYSIVMGAKPTDILKEVAPKGSEPYVAAHADKFIGTDLADILKKLNVKTVIATGGAAEGAVLYTASHAAFLNFKVIVPVDGAWSGDRFAELSSAYILSHAPTVGQQTTLTSFDKLSF